MKIGGIYFLHGWARMVGLGGILFSMIGWLIFVICFGSFNNADNFYNDVRENRMVRVAALNDMKLSVATLLSNQTIEEDFPENRADSDFFSFYFFAVAFPVAALLTIAHLIVHGLPIVGFIISLVAHLLLTLSFICGSAVWFAEGNRLFSNDNNYRNEINAIAPLEVVPEDWKSDRYWGAWLVGEWVGVLIAGIGLLVYYVVTPFFTNPGNVITRKQEAYEMDVK